MCYLPMGSKTFLLLHRIYYGDHYRRKCSSFVGKFHFYFHQLLQSTQYSFSVRIFPDQDPASVFVGWVTPDFHWNNDHFRQDEIPVVTVTLGDDNGRVSSR